MQENQQVYRKMLECGEIHLTRKETVLMLKNRIEELSIAKTNENDAHLKKLIFFEECVTLKLLEDILCIPQDIRPWANNNWEDFRKLIFNG